MLHATKICRYLWTSNTRSHLKVDLTPASLGRKKRKYWNFSPTNHIISTWSVPLSSISQPTNCKAAGRAWKRSSIIRLSFLVSFVVLLLLSKVPRCTLQKYWDSPINLWMFWQFLKCSGNISAQTLLTARSCHDKMELSILKQASCALYLDSLREY